MRLQGPHLKLLQSSEVEWQQIVLCSNSCIAAWLCGWVCNVHATSMGRDTAGVNVGQGKAAAGWQERCTHVVLCYVFCPACGSLVYVYVLVFG